MSYRIVLTTFFLCCSLRSSSGGLKLGLFARNVFDEEWVMAMSPIESRGVDLLTYHQPRSVGGLPTARQPAQQRETMPRANRRNLPLVYSCSGCSSAAQTSNDVALELNRRGLAEMSCIAGVGGDVPALVKVAKSGRPIIAIDGCALACVKNTLARHGVAPTVWHQLKHYDVAKVYGADPEPADIERVLEIVVDSLTPSDGGAQREHS